MMARSRGTVPGVGDRRQAIMIRSSTRLFAVFAVIAMLSLDAGSGPGLSAQASYSQRVLSGNSVGLTVSNFGFFGNNFTSRNPSMEYPYGTGYEHLVHGGLWIGASALDDAGAFLGVTTGCLDISQGIAPQGATEFTPVRTGVTIRSSSIASPFYSPDAVSQMDALSWYGDGTVRQASGNPELHRPLKIEVRQECYLWAIAEYQHVLFVRYFIRNLGPPLANVWVGHYSEFASGPKNDYSSWPPSPGGSVHGGWYFKKLLAYDSSLRLLREHRCDGYPIPSGCHFEVTPYWAGIQLLTE